MITKNYDHDLIIIGAGPAGLTAAIYVTRSGLNCAVIEGGVPGGNLVVTQAIENYPGFEKVDGPDLAYKMYDQVVKLGVKFYYSKVEQIITSNDSFFQVILKNKKVITSKFVFIATGMQPNKPNIPSLLAKEQKGVSYCAICDGALYKDQETLVIGGGNSAVEESFFLLNICTKVHLVLRRDVFRADANIVERLKSHNNVIIHYDSLVDEVHGVDQVDGVTIRNIKTGKKTLLPNIKAVFPYIGQNPQTAFISDLGILNEAKFVIVDNHFQTKIKNLYAIGDVVAKELRQIVTAVNDGAIAAKDIISK